ncbi:MAG: DUF2189 domain-containing protein [Betaproteobacteria bacterium]
MAENSDPVFVRLTLKSLSRAIARGWSMFLQTRRLSVTYSMIFALIGVSILIGIARASFAPMIFPLAGGFMLLGPVLLSGFFALADRLANGKECSFSDLLTGYSRTSREIVIVAAICTLLFMIWVIDAGMLYGLLVGHTPVNLYLLITPTESVITFLLLTSLIGILLAFAIFSISAFSVPLLYYRRAGLFQAIYLSISAVFANLLPILIWTSILSISIIASILIFPLFLLSFPVLAFASHALYRELFPE